MYCNPKVVRKVEMHRLTQFVKLLMNFILSTVYRDVAELTFVYTAQTTRERHNDIQQCGSTLTFSKVRSTD